MVLQLWLNSEFERCKFTWTHFDNNSLLSVAIDLDWNWAQKFASYFIASNVCLCACKMFMCVCGPTQESVHNGSC